MRLSIHVTFLDIENLRFQPRSQAFIRLMSNSEFPDQLEGDFTVDYARGRLRTVFAPSVVVPSTLGIPSPSLPSPASDFLPSRFTASDFLFMFLNTHETKISGCFAFASGVHDLKTFGCPVPQNLRKFPFTSKARTRKFETGKISRFLRLNTKKQTHCLVQHNKQSHRIVLLISFHLNDHT